MSSRRRPAGKPCAIEIARAADRELMTAFGVLLPQLGPEHGEPSKGDLAVVIGSSANTVLLARHPDTRAIVGTLTLSMIVTPTGSSGWISDVVVDASARGTGSGEALVLEALRVAARKGARYVDLTSRPARVAANRLYLRLGFVKRQTNYYRYAIQAPPAETQRPGIRGRRSR